MSSVQCSELAFSLLKAAGRFLIALKRLRVNVSKNQRKMTKSRTWLKNRFVPFFVYR